MGAHDSDVAYLEIHGRLEQPSRPAAGDLVVLSNIDRGVQTSPGAAGLTVRFVARGSENYTIGGRAYRLEAGQVMIAPHEGGANCEVRGREQAGTLGLCTLVRGSSNELDWIFGPLVFGADCMAVGGLLRDGTRALWTGGLGKQRLARQLIDGIRSELPEVSQSIVRKAAAVDAAKPATRYEMVRRAHLAQAYLHAVVNRPIELDEVANAVGTSPFALLRAFQQCFGETPASYQRKLRLECVLAEVKRRKVPISAVADDFGFAGASGFSHAYRRAYGRAPIWTRAPA